MKGRAFAAVVLSALLLLSGLGIGGWWLLWQRGPLQLAHHPLAMPRAARFVPASASFSLYLFSDGQSPVDYARAVAPARQRRPAGEAIARLRDGAFAAAGLDYQDELAGWLGGDIAMALFEDPLAAAAEASEQPARGWLLALASRDDDGARRFLQRFWQTRSLAGTDLQVSRYRGMGLISGRGALVGSRPEPLATALVDDDLVLIASGRNLLERALDVSQIPELNQAGQPLLRQGVAAFGSGAALAVASPVALQSWLGLPSLEGLTALPVPEQASPDRTAGEPAVRLPADRAVAPSGRAAALPASGEGAKEGTASGASGRSDRPPAGQPPSSAAPQPRVAAPASATSQPAAASASPAAEPEAVLSPAEAAAPPAAASLPPGPAAAAAEPEAARSSGHAAAARPPATGSADNDSADNDDSGDGGAQERQAKPQAAPAAGPSAAAGDAAAALPDAPSAPASLPRHAPWAARPALALVPTAASQPAPATASLLAVLQPQGRQLELRARLLLPQAPRLTAAQPELGEALLAALRGSPSSLALIQDPAALGQQPLLRPLLERSLGLRPEAGAERLGPLPDLLARSIHGPLLASQAAEGWQLASRAADPAAADLEPLLRQAGLLEAPVEMDGHSLRVWTHLSLPGRSARRDRGGGDALVAPLAGWREQRQELAWWGQTLAALDAPADSRPLMALRRGLRELGVPQAPLQWSLDADAARSLLRAWQPWRLLSALAGGGLDGPVHGLALAVESPPEVSGLELRARLNLGA